MTSISAVTTHRVKREVTRKIQRKAPSTKAKTNTNGAKTSPLSLVPNALAKSDDVNSFLALPSPDQQLHVSEFVRRALGDSIEVDAPRKDRRSESQYRASAAADLAVAAKCLGAPRVLGEYEVMGALEAVLGRGGRTVSAVPRNFSCSSLASMNSVTSTGSQDDVPVEAREGALLVIRCLCEIVGRAAEPYVVPFLGSVLSECRSSHSSLRDCAARTCRDIVDLAHPLATAPILVPILFRSMVHSNWRVKQNALETLSRLSITAPAQISSMLPLIIPNVTKQIWDTKPQVTKAASDCLKAIFDTNLNPDVAPAVPRLVDAIVRPTETHKAVDELLSTTFVAKVDASTLAIICPILSRALKDKLASKKRAVCIVIENMSRLVESPEAVAPFGPLLVPDLKKVVEEVQFEDIRDVALAALHTLTRALGHGSIEEAYKSIMEKETKLAEIEQNKIEEERLEELRLEEEMKIKEQQERKAWKEAMEAQRMLDQLAIKEEERKRDEEMSKKESDKVSVKTRTGKCQGCGLKKCKKTCLFF